MIMHRDEVMVQRHPMVIHCLVTDKLIIFTLVTCTLLSSKLFVRYHYDHVYWCASRVRRDVLRRGVIA
jgi:hypothetical protein